MSHESNRTAGGSSDPATEVDGITTTDVTTTDRVLAKIAGLAAAAVPGVHALGGPGGATVAGEGPVPGVRVAGGEQELVVHLALTVEDGVHIPDLAQDVRGRVQDAVRRMTDLEVGAVHVTVLDVHRPAG